MILLIRATINIWNYIVFETKMDFRFLNNILMKETDYRIVHSRWAKYRIKKLPHHYTLFNLYYKCVISKPEKHHLVLQRYQNHNAINYSNISCCKVFFLEINEENSSLAFMSVLLSRTAISLMKNDITGQTDTPVSLR